MTNDGTSTGLIPYVNGTAQTAKNGSTVSFTGFVLGIYSGGTQPWGGYIAEVLVYNAVLSATNRQTVEGYLASKWGLQSSLPAGHPYKSTSPPTGIGASILYATATISFTPSVGATSYTVTSNTGGYTGTSSSSPITLIGLAPGTYTFTVTATGVVGTSVASATSNPVTVTAPAAPAGVAFSPAYLSPVLALWLDASDTSTITSSSGNVTQWNDKSGLVNNFTQSNTTYSPVVASSALNGRSVMNLTSGKYMTNTTCPMGTNYTAFAVGYTSVNGWGRLLNGSSVDAYFFLGTGNGVTQYATFVGNGAGWNDTAANLPTTSVASACIMEMTNDGTSTGLIPYVNATAQTAKNGSTASFMGFILGCSNGFNQPWGGYIAEVLIYKSVLSTTDRQTVEGYLASKWGLQSSLPAGHPYKSTSPPIGIGATSLGSTATVWFTASPSAISYTATSSPSGLTGTLTSSASGTLSMAVSGLTLGNYYTFTLTATGLGGTSLASTASNSVTMTAPAAPTVVSATILGTTATVSFTASSSATSYTVFSNTGGFTGTLTSSASGTLSTTVIGLIGGTSYTFTVKATNAAGTSPSSTASNSVTAVIPVIQNGTFSSGTGLPTSASANGTISAVTNTTLTYWTVNSNAVSDSVGVLFTGTGSQIASQWVVNPYPPNSTYVINFHHAYGGEAYTCDLSQAIVYNTSFTGFLNFYYWAEQYSYSMVRGSRNSATQYVCALLNGTEIGRVAPTTLPNGATYYNSVSMPITFPSSGTYILTLRQVNTEIYYTPFHALLSNVSISATGRSPTAWYKFDNASNIGLDTTGSYSMTDGNSNITTSTDILGTGLSAVFNGINNYLTIASGVDLGSKSFSICFWLYHYANSGYNTIFSCYYPAGSGGGVLQVRMTSTLFTFDFYGYSISANITKSDQDLWVHWAVVYNTDASGTNFYNAYIYRNGILAASGSMTVNLTPASTVYQIGRQYTASSYEYLDGQLDDFRIYANMALTVSNVSQIMTELGWYANAIATVSGTIATVSFTAFTGATNYTVTSSPGGLTGTLTSAASGTLSTTVSGLTAGTSYTFTVKTTKSNGTLITSAASNALVPGRPLSFVGYKTMVTNGLYNLYVFTSTTITGSIRVSNGVSTTLYILAIGGGGSGGCNWGGGGGAGGYVENIPTLSAGTETITINVGSGGASVIGRTDMIGNKGLDTTVTFAYSSSKNITAYGGGGGSAYGYGFNAVQNGASGGGGSNYGNASGAPGIAGQGNSSGNLGGAGGGAGGSGADGSNSTGNGGAGKTVSSTLLGIYGSTYGNYYWAGGGAGQSGSTNSGGIGGGGGGSSFGSGGGSALNSGGTATGDKAGNGGRNTGSGGGGGAKNTGGGSGSGGSGIVIVAALSSLC